MRIRGYYWCYNISRSDWEVYYWNERNNTFMEGDLEYEESEFSEIDEKQIKRE